MDLQQIIPYLPHLQAVLNVTTTLFLVAGYIQIRRRNRCSHRNYMISSLITSTIFMASYMTYHATVGYLPFAGSGFIRPIYFSMLASHVVLAALIVPMVLVTVGFAANGNFNIHPRIARWTLPLWLYVSVSGVLVYVLGYHIYSPEA